MTDKENLTKDYIFQAFKQLLTKTNYNNISVCDICEKAGVSRMSFYRNFKSKEELTYKGIEKIFDSLKESIHNQAKPSTYSITKEIFECFKKYKDLLFSLEGTKISKELTDLVFHELTHKFQSDYMSKSAKYVPIFYFGAIAVTALHWLNTGCDETPEEMARMAASLINFEP